MCCVRCQIVLKNYRFFGKKITATQIKLKMESYTILHHKKLIPLIGWAKYQIQSKDFVRVELLDFLSAYQTEKEIRGLLAGV